MNKYTSDYFSKRALEENHPTRSYYKLEEIDKKFYIINRSNIILDLGSSLGGWTEYCSKKVYDGKVLGIDLIILDTKVASLKNVYYMQKDINDTDIIDCIINSGWTRFDVIISDLSPSTTGIKVADQYNSFELSKKAFDITIRMLKENGNFVCKIFESPHVKIYTDELRKCFSEVKSFRPKSTRQGSKELYIIGKNRLR